MKIASRFGKSGIKENNVYIAEDENGQIVGFATGGKERPENMKHIQGNYMRFIYWKGSKEKDLVE